MASEAADGFDPSQIRHDLLLVAQPNVKLGIARDNARWLGVDRKRAPESAVYYPSTLKLDRSRQKQRYEAASGGNAKNGLVCLI